MAPPDFEKPTHLEAVRTALREHIESIQPGDTGSIDRVQLGLSNTEFTGTLELLQDLEQAGAVRLGEVIPGEKIEFERLR